MKTDDETRKVEQTLRECLAGFSLFVPPDPKSYQLCAVKPPRDSGSSEPICIGYSTQPASIHLQIEGPICYIIDMEIAEALRRKGIGRELYGCIENFCRKIGCLEIQTTPSGQGVFFWPKMGFAYFDPQRVGARKSLT